MPKSADEMTAGGRGGACQIRSEGKSAQPTRKRLGIWGKLVTLPWGEGGFQAAPSGTPLLPPGHGPMPGGRLTARPPIEDGAARVVPIAAAEQSSHVAEVSKWCEFRMV